MKKIFIIKITVLKYYFSSDMYGIVVDYGKVKKDFIKTCSITGVLLWLLLNFLEYKYSVEHSGTLASEFIRSPVVLMN